jgi:hypothetical protein
MAEHSATRLLAVLAWAQLDLGELAEAEQMVALIFMESFPHVPDRPSLIILALRCKR